MKSFWIYLTKFYFQNTPTNYRLTSSKSRHLQHTLRKHPHRDTWTTTIASISATASVWSTADSAFASCWNAPMEPLVGGAPWEKEPALPLLRYTGQAASRKVRLSIAIDHRRLTRLRRGWFRLVRVRRSVYVKQQPVQVVQPRIVVQAPQHWCQSDPANHQSACTISEPDDITDYRSSRRPPTKFHVPAAVRWLF